MSASVTQETIHTVQVRKEATIAAPIEIAFEALLEEMGPGSQLPDGKPFPMLIEAWPGGRWYRDLGNNTGHLWGHVQVIKPPTLLEITGPLFMSYPAASHLQYRLTPQGKETHLKLTHRAMGLLPDDHLVGIDMGWEYTFKRIQEIAEQKMRGR
jgi:uncharacterized protein YndB with AHSA1/START domain